MSKWPPKIGVTIGKFKPFHRGHELMISMAAAELDELTVIVADSENNEYDGDLYIPLSFRYAMVKDAVRHLSNVRVVKHIDAYGDAQEYDEHGTAIDEGFWKYWIDKFITLVPDANYFVSSDRYGQEAARRMTKNHFFREVSWYPVDPDRELVDISATRIRQDPFANWKYIHPSFRQMFGKRVLVIGPESSGKTTLTKALGKALNSPVVPEYGRTLSEAKNNNLTPDDFLEIANRHHEMELFAIRNSETGVVISDTDIYTTYLFSEIYLQHPLEELKRKHTPSWYHLVILLPPEIEWDNDGTRVMPDYLPRYDFFKKLCHAYDRHPNAWVMHGVTDLNDRVNFVCIKVAELLESDQKERDSRYEHLTKDLKPVTLIE